tara:strand:- start:345 stop:653 length:309 start_codon:yes stop_codon:yes gene_type:complete
MSEERWNDDGMPNVLKQNKVSKTITWNIQVNNWELKLIRKALTGRLTDDEDIILAKHLGYTLLDYQTREQMNGMKHFERMKMIAEQGLEESKEQIKEIKELD